LIKTKEHIRVQYGLLKSGKELTSEKGFYNRRRTIKAHIRGKGFYKMNAALFYFSNIGPSILLVLTSYPSLDSLLSV
jgi:hypothetical protein